MKEPAPPTNTARSIGSLLIDWDVNTFDNEEHPEVRWDVKVIFDHDYTQHILVKQWLRTDEDIFAHVGWSLWHIGDETMFIKEWPNTSSAPLIDAAAQVSAWESMCEEVWSHIND